MMAGWPFGQGLWMGKRQCWHAFQMKYSLSLFQCCRGRGLRWTQGLRAHARRYTFVSGSKWGVGESSSVPSFPLLTWTKDRIALFPESSPWVGELIFLRGDNWVDCFLEGLPAQVCRQWHWQLPVSCLHAVASSAIVHVLCVKFEFPTVGKIWFLGNSSCTQIHFISIYFWSLKAGKMTSLLLRIHVFRGGHSIGFNSTFGGFTVASDRPEPVSLTKSWVLEGWFRRGIQ